MKTKKIIISTALLLLTFFTPLLWRGAGGNAFAQNNVGIGILVPAPSSLLDLTATDKGLLTPRMNSLQRNTIAAPATGLLIYNTDCNLFNYFNGTGWIVIDGISISGPMTGITSPCLNATNIVYSVPAVPSASNYNWTVPAGASIVSGQGTPSITVNFGNTDGNICVTASNSCDTSNVSCLAIKISAAPNAPIALAASNFTCTSFNANWASSPDAVTYLLDVATSGSFGTGTFVTGYNNLSVNNVTTYNIAPLLANTTYYYRVRVVNGCDTSLFSNTINVSTTSPVAPTATVASNFTCTSMNANWGAATDASNYFLEVSTSASFGIGTFVTGYNNVNVNNVTTYNVTGLTSSTTYYYRVRAGNGCDTSLYSNTVSVSTTAPVAPTAAAASNFTCTSVNANWGAVTGATAYFLEVSTSASFGTGTFVTGYNNVNVNNVTTYNITGLTSSSTYYYRVRAGNGCDTSLYSNTISVSTTAPVAPTAAAASNFTCTSVNANWGAVTGATTYYLEVSTSASFGIGTFVTGYNNVNVNNVTTYNITGLTSSATYYYRVRAGNGCDTSLYSNTISVSTTAPVAPTAAAASNFTCTSVNANWGAVTGATTYFLEVSTSASFGTGTFVTGYNNVNVNNVTTYNITGLTSSSTYYYRVRAGNGCDTSLYSNTISVSTTAPVAPTAAAASNFTCTSVNANWGAVTGATTYFLEVSTSASFGTGTFVTGYNNVNVNNVTTYNITGLTSSATYYYRVRAGNGCDTSLYSNTISVSTTAPVAPTASAASNFTCTSVNANWGAVTAATTYYLEVSTSASFGIGTFVTGYNNINVSNVTTYNITGLTSSSTYYYRVRAGNGCDTSLYSNTISVSTTAPVAPTATAASNFTCTSVNANWGAVTAATTYYLEVSTSASFGIGTFVTGYNNINVSNVTTYNITGLTSSSTYYYRVRAGNGCDTSLYSNTISVSTTAPVAPTAAIASNFTCTSVNANWGAVTAATTYYLEVSTSASFGIGTFVTGYNNINVSNVTTYNITGLTSSSTYYYRIRAGNGCDTSLYSNTISVSTTAPVAPTATAASNFTCTSLNANWGAVTAATTYYLEVSTSASFGIGTFVTGYNNINVSNVTTYNITGLTSSSTYYYRVRAGNGCDTSLYSNTISVSTSAPVAPTATAASNFTCISLNANWGAVTAATTYYLEVSTSASFGIGTFVTGYNNINVSNVTTYNITGLTSSSTYYYRVRAGNGCDTSLYSNTISVSTTAPVAPTATAASNFTCTSMNANWGAVTAATTYFLEVSTSATFGLGTFVTGYNNVNVNNVTTYNITGLIANTTYFYRVRAGNGCDTSLYSNTITTGTTAPIAPAATNASNFTCTSMNANWGASAGATTYFLDVATNPTFTVFVAGYSNLDVNNVTTYNITGLTANTTYYYRVRAGNGCSASVNSNTILVMTSAPIAPTAVAASNFTCTSMNANWGAVTGATVYFLDVATDAAFTAFVIGYSNLNVGLATTYNVTGLTANTVYYYRVRAGNGCSTSGNSNTISIGTTAPVAPAAAAATNFTCTSFNANWGASAGATSYFLDVATDAAFTAFVGAYNNMNVTNVTTYNVTGLIINTTYYYRIRASNGCSASSNSNTIMVITTAPIAPTAVAASNFTCTSMNANWGAVAGATAYFLDVATDAAFTSLVGIYSNLNVGLATTKNVTGLTLNTTYYYRVRAGNGCSASLNSNTITVSTPVPIAPAAAAASNFTCTTFNANWGASAGATTYFLDVATDAAFTAFVGTYNNLNVNNVTTLNITGLTVNTTYYYRVRASNGCNASLNSNTIMVITTAPIAPIALAPSNFTCTSMNANWGASAGATTYFLDVATDAAFTAFVGTYNNLNVNNVTTYNISGLTINTTYYYRVRASNGCSASLNSNTIMVITTAPIAPVAVAASNFTCTSMNANWSASAGATTYFLDVATDAAFTAFVGIYNNLNVNNVTTLNITGLIVNTTYYYRVRAGNGCSVSLNSNTINVVTAAPLAPTAVAASNFTCTSMNANWSASLGATTYFLDVATDAAFTAFVGTYNNLNVNNVTTYNISGLTVNVTYYYRIRASNGCSISLNSNMIMVSTTAPIAPTATAASNFTCTSLNANWGAVAGATSYLLDVATDAAFTSYVAGYTNLNVGNTTTTNVTGLTVNVTYYYRVRALNGCSTSLNSSTITVSTSAPISPTAVAASNFTCTSLNANWGAVSGATAYYLDVATDASFTAFVGTYNNLNVNNVTTYNITGLTINTTYYYRVRAANGCSISLNSNTLMVITSAPFAPVGIAASNYTCTSMNANWGASAGATAYFLDVSTSPAYTTFVGVYNNLNVNNVTTYNVTGLTLGTTYYYRVRAGNGCSTSSNSNTVNVSITAPDAPVALSPSNVVCTSMNANWGSAAGAITYFLDVATDASFTAFVPGYNNLNVNNVLTYNITGLSAGVNYYYRVRAANGCSASLNSNYVSVVTSALTAPVANAASSVACTGMNANWSAVSGVISYFLDVSTSPSFTSFVGTYNNLNVGNVTTYSLTGLTVNTTYYYRVRAMSGCTTSSNSNSITASTNAPAAPVATTATNVTCTSMNANWSAVPGAITYFLDVSANASFTSFIGVYNNFNAGNVTTYNITGLPGTTVYFRVRAASGCASGSNSNFIMTDPALINAPVAFAASGIACTVMNANWAAATGAISYFLDVSTSPSFATFLPGYNNLNVSNVLTYNVSGLTVNTTYYYRVRAMNACATSSNSNSITASTNAPAAPVATAATNVTCTSMNTNWSAVSGAISYYIDVATDASFTTFVGIYNNFNVGNVTTYNVTGLTGTTVYYRVRAASGCASGSNSNFVMVNPSAINAPVAFAASGVACTVFNANWAAVTGAISYFLDVSTSPSFALGSFVGAYNNLDVTNVLSYNVSGLTVNTNYYYRVRAMNACVTSPSSNSITASTNAPAAPVALEESNITCTSMNCNWNAVSGAITYYLDIATDASFTFFVAGYNNFNAGNVTTYNAGGLPGSVRYYRVRAASGCASGNNSNFIVADPSILNAPNATAATSITCTFLNANWQSVPGAIAYNIDVSTTPAFTSFVGAYNNLNVGNVLTLNVSGLSANTTYYYRIQAMNACVSSLNSNTITASTFAPNAPVANAASNVTCAGLNANWAAASGALNYFLDVSMDPAFGSFVGIYNNKNVGNVTTYNVTGLIASTIYYYRVRAANGCSASGNSNIITAATTPPAQPAANTVTSYTCTSFLASWGAVGGATSYSIDVSNDPAFGTFIAGYQNLNVGNVLNRNITGLAAGVTYYYRVRTNNNCGTSSSSSSIAFTISAPTIPQPGTWGISCTSFSFGWALSAGATDYKLDVSTNASFTSFVAGFNNLSMGNVSSYNVSGLITGINYYYRMRSANACGSSGNSVNLTIPLFAPGAPTVTNTTISAISCVSFGAVWTGTLGATSYFLDVSTSPAFGTFVGVFNNFNAGSLSAFNVTGLTAGVTYYYRVRGANGCGTSLNSSTVTVTTAVPAAPVSIAGSLNSTTGFTANWSASANATTYYLDVATDAAFANYVTGYNNLNVGNTTSRAVTGLTTGTTYYYRVRASNGCNTSGNSGTITLTTL